jgi:hypothetical protein
MLFSYKGSNRYNTLNFINDFVLLNYQEQIAQNKELKMKYQYFYTNINSDGKTDEMLELFEQQTSYDIEHTIKHLKGRKKSQPILIKQDSLKLPNKISSDFNILEWSALDIAKQLTVTSYNLLSKIEYKELLNTNWTKKEKHLLAPNIMKIIDRFNKLTLFIMEEVLAYDKKKNRAGVIAKFVEVAQECKTIHNYNDCVTIITSLNNFIVRNLVKTWKVMNKQSVYLFNQLTEFCTYEGNYINLRAEIGQNTKQCVPYLGLLLKDLAFIEEGPKYLNKDSLVNLEKVNKVAETINSFLAFKNKTYSFKSIRQLMILDDLQPLSEEEIEILANKIGIFITYIEPVYNLSKKKTPKKRLTNSDKKLNKDLDIRKSQEVKEFAYQ